MAAAAAARAWTGADVVRVAIDMSYGDLMSLKELRSTAQQAMLCWAAVRRAARPCALSLTSVTAVRERHARAPLAHRICIVNECSIVHPHECIQRTASARCM